MKRNQFKDFLLGLQKPLIVTIETETLLDMVKKNRETGEPNPYLNKIVRRTLRHGMLNCSYENAVNNQRGRETPIGEFMEEFKAESLWHGAGEHIGQNKVMVRHRVKGAEYIVLLPKAVESSDERGDSREYHPLNYNDRYFHIQNDSGERKEINKDLLIPYLKNISSNERQDTDKPVFYRTIELKNVVGVKYKEELIPIED